MSLQLEVVADGRTVVASSGALSIGRDATCDLVIANDRRISREHVRLERSDGVWYAVNVGQWGTFHQGAPIERMAIAGITSLRLADPDDGALIVIRPPERGAIPPASTLGSAVNRYASFVGDRSIGATVRIGRGQDNDLVIDDFLVSRHHAQLVQSRGSFELQDLSSRNGTFVNGRPINRTALNDGDVIAIGRRMLVFARGQLREYTDDNATLVVRDIRVEVDRGNKVLLDRVSFAVEPGQLVAIVGTSGAGKSTLIKVLTGSLPVTDGSVVYNGRSLHAAIDELGPRLGYVPQDDILHSQLPLRSALRYAADLRFAPDVPAIDRDRRVQTVMEQLGIADRADLVVSRLSGGQRKRASIALELLTEPSLLFLDEPTSGLDPGFERSVMELLRALADSGRTIVVITHATASLDLCDRLLFLSSGGHPAYYGPPGEALAYFGGSDWSDAFRRIEAGGADWPAKFASSPLHERHVAQPLRNHEQAPASAPTSPGRRWHQPKRQQFRTLVRRNASVLWHTNSQLYLLAVQAPAIALLLRAALGADNFRGVPGGGPRSLLTVLVLAAATMGLVNSAREIVRELPIYRRERAVGLHPGVYLASKAVYLTAIGSVQIAVLIVIVVLPQGVPASSGLVLPAVIELGIVLFLTLVAAIALGLAVSALVDTDATAVVLIPVLLIAQLVLANAMLVVDDKPGLAQAAWLSPSSWGFAGAAASLNLKLVERRCGNYVAVLLGGDNLSCSGLFDHKVQNLVIAAVMLVALSALFMAVAYRALRWRDPQARRA